MMNIVDKLPVIFVSLVLVSFMQATEGPGMKIAATVPLPCESSGQIISPTGNQVAVSCSDHTLRLVDVASGTTQHVFAAEPLIDASKYSQDGRWFAVGLWDGTVEVVPTSGVAAPRQWKGDTRRIETLEFFPDSSAIVVGALDRPGQIWDLRGAPKPVATLHSDFSGLLACSFSPDGKLLVTADGDTVIRFYDTATWQMLHEYRGETLETFAVAFTPDGKRAVLGGPADRITALDPATGGETQKFVKDAAVIQQILFFGSDGRGAVLYSDGDGKQPPHQTVWNVNTAKSVPLAAPRALTGGGVVRGKLWVSSPSGNALEIWVYE